MAKQVFQDNIKDAKTVDFILPPRFIRKWLIYSASDKENKPDDKNALGSSLKKPLNSLIPTGKQIQATTATSKIPKMEYITKDELEETPKYSYIIVLII